MEQKVTVDGKTVEVQVYEDGEGGWLIEIVDEHWNSTCWENSFETADLAFAEAMRAINEEGIDGFIGAGGNTTH
ncbi:MULTISPECIES: hypothetical protein [Pseudomonas]|uniref:Uncharacterized protein n=1 Tax=Pseudomonas gingeri TaxID=117681 RepID=A0A7Y7WAM7_9PSED|nr:MULTISPECIES: hypothetical protein [Pseudomonas]MPQ68576.1 hypothetical protein [Pseudomonas sp. MWU12-2323]NWB45850.1 hypothetical protein [Pseudomonas gingeri]